MKQLAYLNKYLWKYKWYLLGGIVFLIGSNYLKTLQPVIVRWAFDFTSELLDRYSSVDAEGFDIWGIESRKLMQYAIYIIGLTIAGGILLFLTRQTMIVMSRLIERDLRNELYQHYNILDQKFYKSNNTGDLMSRITEDVAKVRMYLGPGIMYTVNLVSVFILVIYSMLSVSVELTLYVLTPLPLLSISIYYVSNLINKHSAKIQKQLSYLTTLSQEIYSGIRVIKSFNQEKSMFGYFDEETESYKSKNLTLARIRAMFFPLMILLIGTSTIICIYKGGLLVQQGVITTGNIAEFIIYVNMLSWPMTAIGWIASLVQEAAASQERINQFLKTEPDTYIEEENKTIPDIKGKIEFRNVSFTYPETGIKALDEMNFTINEGDRVLILGRTGSGKSTIFDLIMGIYPQTNGEILIDNMPLESYNLGMIRKQIAFVPQDVFLFSNTIKENIAFGLKSVPDQAVISEFATLSAIDKEIQLFKEGYDTLVGERGVTLSGGQKQRISLARSLITDPQVVILDDTFSAIDAHAEATIIQHIDEKLRNRTCIISAHRVYPHLRFDQIFVLEDGKITERGNHSELSVAGGYYQEIYEKQRREELNADRV